MTLEGLVQPQDDSSREIGQPGLGDQVGNPSGEDQPGAEEQSPRTYSQDDWDKREKVHVLNDTSRRQ
jgi:hypothetical protein